MGEAARGDRDSRTYPWGDTFQPARCNSGELELGDTTPVGVFLRRQPYGVLDMSGNVWEWCLTKWRESYAEPEDNSSEGDERRVLRGGAFDDDPWSMRCAVRYWFSPVFRNWSFGFEC